MQAVRFAIVLGVLAAVAGCYRPDFKNCQIGCGPGLAACPEGLVCSAGLCSAPDVTCHPDASAETSADIADDAPDASDASDGGPDAPPDVGDDAWDAAPDEKPDVTDGDLDANPDVRDGGPDVPPAVAPCPLRQYRNVVRDICVPSHDLNGDGKADLIAVRASEHHALISDGSRFTFAKWLDGGFWGERGALADDVTGDGYADSVGFGYRYVGVVSGDGMGSGSTKDYTTWAAHGLFGNQATLLADANGDGRADTIAVSDREIAVALSDGAHFPGLARWASGNFADVMATFAADADGDGKSDVIGVRPSGISVWLSDGGSFQAEAVWRPSKLAGLRGTFFADVDGDGRADGVRLDDVGIWVARSTGAAFAEDQRWFDGALNSSAERFMADADGDGRADVISVYSSSVTVSLSTGTWFAPPTTWYSGQFHSDFNFSVTTAPAPAGSFGSARPANIGVVGMSTNQWLLRTRTALADAQVDFHFGEAGDIPVIGDWDGDGVVTMGVVRPDHGELRWRLRNSASTGAADTGPADIDFVFGSQIFGDEPVTGDWNRDGKTTIGLVRREPSQDGLRWMLRDTNSAGLPDRDFVHGAVTLQDLPVVGDWDNDGTTTVGVFRPLWGEWFLRNSNTSGDSDVYLPGFGAPGDLPLSGDWNGTGRTSIGVFRPVGSPFNPSSSQPEWTLRDELGGPIHFNLYFGAESDRPITGKWSPRP